MRNIDEVVGSIIKEIPHTWELKQNLIDAIDIMMEGTRWTAPEIRVIRFEKLAVILENYLGRPIEEWKQKIWRIFNDDI